MSRSSYLKQLAQRTSDRLPILMPSRSSFQASATIQPLEPPVAESLSTARSPSLSPPLETSKTTVVRNSTPVKEAVELSPDLPIESPGVQILPSAPIVPLPNSTLPNTTKSIEEPISSTGSLASAEEISDRETSTFIATNQSQSEFRQEKVNTSPSTKEQPTTKQQSELILPSPPEISFLPPQKTITPSQKNRSDLPPRLFPVSTSDRLVPADEISSYPAPLGLPAKSLPKSATGNSIHIGAIEIQITPPAPPLAPPPVTPPAAKPTSTAPLSRGFSSSFGLRQG